MTFGYLVELARSASESERLIGTALPCAAGAPVGNLREVSAYAGWYRI